MSIKAEVYLNGRLIHTVIGMRSDSPEVLKSRVENSIQVILKESPK
jgi:hypothetical protein